MLGVQFCDAFLKEFAWDLGYLGCVLRDVIPLKFDAKEFLY